MATRDWFVGAALAVVTLIPAAAPAATIVGDWVEVLATTSHGAWADQGYHELGVVQVGGPTQTVADPMAPPDRRTGNITPSQIVPFLIALGRHALAASSVATNSSTSPTLATSATPASYTPGVALSFFGGDVFVNITKVTCRSAAIHSRSM